MERLSKDLLVGTLSHVAGRVKKIKPSADSLVLFIDSHQVVLMRMPKLKK
jgi:hypothetical protein